MAASVLVDAGFLVALLSRRDTHHAWARAQASQSLPPWYTCEAALAEAFHLFGVQGATALGGWLRRRTMTIGFALESDYESTLALMRKYANVPMSLADACLVRMTEVVPDPVVITTDSDFRIYRRHSRNIVPCIIP